MDRNYARQSVGGRREIPQSTYDVTRIAPRSGERSYDLCGFAEKKRSLRSSKVVAEFARISVCL